jgi:hypothetical protein
MKRVAGDAGHAHQPAAIVAGELGLGVLQQVVVVDAAVVKRGERGLCNMCHLMKLI